MAPLLWLLNCSVTFDCFILQPLARLGAEVTGVDASSRNIHSALRHACHDPMVADRVRYKCTTVEELAEEEPESFDCVVASEVIEHVTDKDTFISASTQLVKVSKNRHESTCIPPVWPRFDSDQESCGSSLLLVLILAPRVFHRVRQFLSLHKNKHFQIPIRSAIRGPQDCQS